MLQAPTEFGAELDREATMSAVGLEPGEAHPELPPQIVSTGLAHAIAPLADAASLARTEPDYPAIDELLAPNGAVVLYLAWCEAGRGRARGYSRIVELGEDPATGSAVGPSARTSPSARARPRSRSARARRWGARACSRPRWRVSWSASAAPRSR